MNHWSKNHSLQEQASDVVRKHMVITGLVQGVGFRYFTVIQARQLGVSGWVRTDTTDQLKWRPKAVRSRCRRW